MMQGTPMPIASTAGLLGKAPCHAEFLKINAGEPLCRRLHQWLEDGMGALRQAGNPPLAGPYGFVFSAPGERNVLVGSLRGSTDEAGRAFPLCIFFTAPAASMAGGFAGAPIAFEPFLSAAAALLKRVEHLDVAELGTHVRALPVPTAVEMDRAHETSARVLGSARGGELVSLLTDGAGADGPYYAFRTFLTACENVAVSGQKGQITLDCPFPATLGPSAWLELARRRLRPTDAPPSFFWSDGRLLLCLGEPSTHLLVYLAKPQHQAMKLWPLRTAHLGAAATARQALSASQRSGIERADGTLEDLLATLAA